MSTNVTSEDSLGNRVRRGLGWSVVGQAVTRVGVFATGIVLARLLTHEDFGIYAVTLVALNLLGAINELGMIPAIVRSDEADERKTAATGLTLALGFSTLLYLVIFAVAPAFARALHAPEAAGVLRLLALTLIVDGASSQSQALLHKTFRQDRQTAAVGIGTVAYAAVTVALAATGLGPWSLAWGRLAGSVITGGLFAVFAPFRQRPGFDRRVAREMMRFGAPLAGSALVAEAVLNVDYLIVGRTLGTVALGVYLLAFNLSSWPVSTVSTAIAQVSFAGFARLVHDRDRLRSAFTKAFSLAVVATVPIVAILVVLAPEVVGFLYGAKWSAAVTPVRFLLFVGGLRVLLELGFDLVAADGRSHVNLLVRLAWLVVLTPCLVIGAELAGLRGVGLGHAFAAAAVALPLLFYAGRRSELDAAAIGKHAVRPLLGGVAATAAMLATLPAVNGQVPRLVLAGTVGLLVYALVALTRNPLLQRTRLRTEKFAGQPPVLVEPELLP